MVFLVLSLSRLSEGLVFSIGFALALLKISAFGDTVFGKPGYRSGVLL